MALSVSEYLYPELMSIDGLIETLKQRYVKVDRLESLEKHELVELYYKYILPLPQRKYRQNRRGREMTKKQIITSKKRKVNETENTDEANPQKRKSAGNLLTSFEPPPAVLDRLKPPPSCVDFKKKTIKLGSQTAALSMSPISCSINKLKLSKPSANDSAVSPTKKLRITASSPSETSLGKQKTIKLINSHLQSNKSNSITGSHTQSKQAGTVTMCGEKSVEQVKRERTETPMDTSDITAAIPEVKERKKIRIKRIALP